MVRSDRLGICLIASLLAPCSATLHAQHEIFRVDPAASEVHFALGDPLHAVRGTFHVAKGSFEFTPHEESGSMSGSVTVDAKSGESGNGTRDRKMADDELKAADFSTITFAPKRYTGKLALTGSSNITVEGTFTLLGTPHEINVPMQVVIDGGHCKATGSFVVPYVKWGLKDPSVFVLRVGKEVTIHLALAGSIAGV